MQLIDVDRLIQNLANMKMYRPDFQEPVGGYGTGMELSICREIIKQHLGDIAATRSAGSLFIQVCIPLCNTIDLVLGEGRT